MSLDTAPEKALLFPFPSVRGLTRSKTVHKELTMRMRLNRRRGVFGVAVLLATGLAWIGPGLTAQGAIDGDDIGGIVRSANGPEAGVWVIAETNDFDTLYRKTVVTGDGGRYVLPDLPNARYRVWVRGYGLKDSEPVTGAPGTTLNLQAVQAANPREAAQVYPANYWYSLVEVPAESEFPGTGENGNGISPGMRTQAAWIDGLKQGCQLCHQLGNQATREVLNPADFDSTEAAWAHRVRVGQRGALMSGGLRRFGADRVVAMYADWTDRVMAGEVPPAPPRPQGQERNVVLTMWEWGGETGYIHDEIATDKRNPQVNAGGPIYGVEFANDKLVWVDPVTHEARAVTIPVRDTPGEEGFKSYIDQENLEPSIYWGDDLIWNNPGNPHNPMMDGQGRVWMTHQIRGPGNPAWCQEGSSNPYAQHYPLTRAARGDALDPTKDKEMGAGWYGIVPDPTEDHVVWAASGGVPGQIVRLGLGANPPETCIAEYYQPPFDNPNAPIQGYSPRGIDITTDGIIWTALSGSGHMASFDRSRCTVLNGPTATGQHCPDGWTLHATPGPQMKGVTDQGSADFHYYSWVDQHDTLGLGNNIPIATGSTSDSLLAFLPDQEEFLIMRVPYPLGFYSRGMDGRIDDPNTGWKGRAVWADYGTNAVWHTEGGKGTQGNLVKFQVRPDPLAH